MVHFWQDRELITYFHLIYLLSTLFNTVSTPGANNRRYRISRPPWCCKIQMLRLGGHSSRQHWVHIGHKRFHYFIFLDITMLDGPTMPIFALFKDVRKTRSCTASHASSRSFICLLSSETSDITRTRTRITIYLRRYIQRFQMLPCLCANEQKQVHKRHVKL